jgi:ribonuclease D
MLPSLRNRAHKAHADKIWEIRKAALALPDSGLPQSNKKSGALPPPKAWADRNPEAAARWEKVRPALNAIAEELEIAPEVLVSPEPIRQFCWDPTSALDSLDEWLRNYKVRQWQIDFISPILLATD